jgi:hypothetical protein
MVCLEDRDRDRGKAEGRDSRAAGNRTRCKPHWAFPEWGSRAVVPALAEVVKVRAKVRAKVKADSAGAAVVKVEIRTARRACHGGVRRADFRLI